MCSITNTFRMYKTIKNILKRGKNMVFVNVLQQPETYLIYQYKYWLL